jgi:hypothetical protein
MNIEIHFEENKERRINSYNFSGTPFYPEISENKKNNDDDFDDNPHGWYLKQSEELQRASDEVYDDMGREGWIGFLADCKWYQEHLKK